MNTDAHLVASRMYVERWAEPCILDFFVLVKLWHFEYTWARMSVYNTILLFFHCFHLLLLLVDSFHCKLKVEYVVILMLL